MWVKYLCQKRLSEIFQNRLHDVDAHFLAKPIVLVLSP
jgi:hypothetical protein